MQGKYRLPLYLQTMGFVPAIIGEQTAIRLKQSTTIKAHIDSFLRRKRNHACRQKPSDLLLSLVVFVWFIRMRRIICRKSWGQQKRIACQPAIAQAGSGRTEQMLNP